MERKRFNILRFLLFLVSLLPISICQAETSGKSKPLDINVTLRVIEQASRIELGSEKIKLTDNQLVNQPLKMGNALKNYIISMGTRRVNVDGAGGYIWIEARLKDPSGSELAYLVTTTSLEKFSIGTGFKLKGTKDPLVLMIDNM